MRSERALTFVLDAVSRIDEDYLLSFPATPRLYESGVVYLREPRGWEIWQDIPTALKTGVADCEDLSAWRSAEYRRRGVDAWPLLYGRWSPGGWQYHVIVALPDGTYEDPSVVLGMPVPFYPPNIEPFVVNPL